jgi:hypothetical protein
MRRTGRPVRLSAIAHREGQCHSKGPFINPGIAMVVSIQLKAQNGAICTLSLSFKRRAARVVFPTGHTGTISRDDLFGKEGDVLKSTYR